MRQVEGRDGDEGGAEAGIRCLMMENGSDGSEMEVFEEGAETQEASARCCESGGCLKDAPQMPPGCFSLDAPKMRPRCAPDAFREPYLSFSDASKMPFESFSDAFWLLFGGHLEVCWKGFRNLLSQTSASLEAFLQQKCSFITGLFLPAYPFAAIYPRLLLGEIIARG